MLVGRFLRRPRPPSCNVSDVFPSAVAAGRRLALTVAMETQQRRRTLFLRQEAGTDCGDRHPASSRIVGEPKHAVGFVFVSTDAGGFVTRAPSPDSWLVARSQRRHMMLQEPRYRGQGGCLPSSGTLSMPWLPRRAHAFRRPHWMVRAFHVWEARGCPHRRTTDAIARHQHARRTPQMHQHLLPGSPRWE